MKIIAFYEKNKFFFCIGYFFNENSFYGILNVIEQSLSLGK